MKKQFVFLVFLIVLLILAFLPFQIGSVKGNPTYEDFTDYTEVDPNEHIEKTANHVDFQCYRNEDAYLYKDKDIDHFNDFEHKVQFRIISVTENFYFPQTSQPFHIDTLYYIQKPYSPKHPYIITQILNNTKHHETY